MIKSWRTALNGHGPTLPSSKVGLMPLFRKMSSPYLTPGRLPDVIAALQVMAANERPEGSISSWCLKLSYNTNPDQLGRWTRVFEEHGEFFLCYRLEQDQATPKAALRIRYVNRLYDEKNDKEYKRVDADQLEEPARSQLTTRPLRTEDVSALTDVAIELHSRALAEEAEKRWWMPILTGLLGVGVALASVYVGAARDSGSGDRNVKIEIPVAKAK